MTKHDANDTIIVLGAGLAGLSLALGLARNGYRVELVEKSFDFGRTGATFGLARNGQKALDELYPGVAQELVELGVHMPSTGGTMLGWWNVRDALLSHVRQESEKINLRTGWLVQDIGNGEKSVTAKFKKRKADGSGVTEEELILEAFVLVGADGVNSSVRQFHNLPSAKKVNIVLWRGRVDIHPEEGESESSDLLRPYLDIPVVPLGIRLRGPMNYVLFNFHPKLEGVMSLVINYQADNVDEVKEGTTPKEFMEAGANDEKELKEIQAILDLTDKDGLAHPVRLKVVELPLEDGSGWGGKGRVTITGDAAHGMRPASGLGGSMAFEDSVILCRVLKKLRDDSRGAPPSKSEVESALQDFENTRLPRIRKIWDDQWERSECSYRNIEMEPWSEEFTEWVFNGV